MITGNNVLDKLGIMLYLLWIYMYVIFYVVNILLPRPYVGETAWQLLQQIQTVSGYITVITAAPE